MYYRTNIFYTVPVMLIYTIPYCTDYVGTYIQYLYFTSVQLYNRVN